MIGSGSSNLSATAPGVQYNVLTVDATDSPTFGSLNLASAAAVSGILPIADGGTGLATTATNGQLLIGNGTGYTISGLTQGTSQGVNIVTGTGSITLDTAQDIRVTASPTFAATVLNGALTSRAISAPGVSAANSGIIYFDTTSHTFQVSQNGSAYGPLTSASGTVTSVATGTGLTGGLLTTTGTLSLATVGTAGVYTKVTTDAVGRVISATTLTGTDIPPHSATLITSGTLNIAQVPSLPATQLTSGTVNIAQIPSLPASQITSGVFSTAQIPSLPATQLTTGTVNIAQVPSLPASQITSGVFSSAQIPSLATTYVAVAGSTMTGSLNLGANTVYANVGVVGTADASNNPGDGTLRSTTGVGANINGGNLILAAGNGTGTGGSGNINFQVANYAASSSTANTLATAMTILPAGNVGVGTTAPGAKLAVGGTSGTDGIQFPDGNLQTTASTSASNSTVVLGSTFTVSAASGVFQDTGLAISLPSAGTYLVMSNLRVSSRQQVPATITSEPNYTMRPLAPRWRTRHAWSSTTTVPIIFTNQRRSP